MDCTAELVPLETRSLAFCGSCLSVIASQRKGNGLGRWGTAISQVRPEAPVQPKAGLQRSGPLQAVSY